MLGNLRLKSTNGRSYGTGHLGAVMHYLHSLHGTRSDKGAGAVERGEAATLCGRRGRGIRYVNHVGIPLRVAAATAKRLDIKVCAACARTWPGGWESNNSNWGL